MPKQHTPEVKARAVAYIFDRLDRYKSVYGAFQDLAPKLSVGGETLRRRALPAQVDAGDRTGLTSEELAQIKSLKSIDKELFVSQRFPLAKGVRPSPDLATEFIDRQRECDYAVMSVLQSPDNLGLEGHCAHLP